MSTGNSGSLLMNNSRQFRSIYGYELSPAHSDKTAQHCPKTCVSELNFSHCLFYSAGTAEAEAILAVRYLSAA